MNGWVDGWMLTYIIHTYINTDRRTDRQTDRQTVCICIFTRSWYVSIPSNVDPLLGTATLGFATDVAASFKLPYADSFTWFGISAPGHLRTQRVHATSLYKPGPQRGSHIRLLWGLCMNYSDTWTLWELNLQGCHDLHE